MKKTRNRRQVPMFKPLRFGKHKGEPLWEVPRSYLAWVLCTVDIDEAVRRDINAVLEGQRPSKQRLLQLSHPSVTVTGPDYYHVSSRDSGQTEPRWVPWEDEVPGAEGEIESRLKDEEIPY